MTTRWRRLWGSLGFRLAFSCGVLVVITLLAALGIVHLQTVGVMNQSIQRQVRTATQQLAARHAEGGLPAVASEIERSLRDGIDSDVEIYLLLDEAGRALAGNIDAIAPPALSEPDQAVEVREAVRRGDQTVQALLRWRSLPDGVLLAVGHDLRALASLERLIGQASVAAAMVAFALLVGGTFVFRIGLEQSVSSLRRTAARISAGDLHERVELHGNEDEFALLKHDINHMLDRIEHLMAGVRNVSDSIAHNLRTPLTRVLLRLRAVQEEEAMPAQARRAEIDATVRDLHDLTVTFEKLLQIAEGESGTRRRRFGPVALHEIADDVADLYDALAESLGARLLRDPADVARVAGDRDLLADALANLLDNAFKYAGEGATVRVGTRSDHGAVVLTVEDDGPGVPHGEHARLGTRFHRIDRSRPGYGLGLASVRAIAALHGGQLRFADAGPGLRVELQLPAARRED